MAGMVGTVATATLAILMRAFLPYAPYVAGALVLLSLVYVYFHRKQLGKMVAKLEKA